MLLLSGPWLASSRGGLWSEWTLSSQQSALRAVCAVMMDPFETRRVRADGDASVATSHAESTVTTRTAPDEQGLLERLRAGDEAAFTTLVERHDRALLRLARVFVPNRSVAEEVVQETWLAVIHALPRFEGRSSLKTWIFRILSNRAKTRGVREGRSVPFTAWAGPNAEHEPAVDPSRFRQDGMWAAPPRRWESDTPEKLLMHKRAVARLRSALTELPPSQGAVVTLRDIEQLDAAEVCEILELSEANQRVLLHRGRSKLRQTLEEHFDGA